MAHMPLQDSLEMPVGSNYLRFHLTLSFGALLGIGAGRLPTTGGPRDRNGARRFGRDLGRNAAEQVAEQRALSRSDYDVVDMVGLREFEDCVCRIDCFEHVDAETMGFELERLGPVPERDEPVDALVMTLLIERGIKRDPSQLENVQTGEPRSGKRRQNALAVVRRASLISLDASPRSIATATIGAEEMRAAVVGLLKDLVRSLLKRLRRTVRSGSRSNRSDLLVSLTWSRWLRSNASWAAVG